MDDRHVMLSRNPIGSGDWEHIKFPHQHVMFKKDTTKGDSHNNIAVGVCPKDGTIHLLFDMHAYSPGGTLAFLLARNGMMRKMSL